MQSAIRRIFSCHSPDRNCWKGARRSKKDMRTAIGMGVSAGRGRQYPQARQKFDASSRLSCSIAARSLASSLGGWRSKASRSSSSASRCKPQMGTTVSKLSQSFSATAKIVCRSSGIPLGVRSFSNSAKMASWMARARSAGNSRKKLPNELDELKASTSSAEAK